MRISRTFFALVFLLVCGSPLRAAPGWQSIGTVSSVKPLPNGVEVRTPQAEVEVVALSPSVVRVRCKRSAVFAPEDSFSVVPETGFQVPGVQVKDSASAVEFSTGEIWVHILKSPLRIEFLNAAGQVILQDHPDHPMAWSGAAFRMWKAMPEDEHYYGLGDKAGPIDHRNQAFTLWNTDAFGWQESTDPLYKSIPFFLALRGGAAYGVFLDNTFRSSFDFGKEFRDSFSFGAEGGALDYYFFYGPHPKKVLQAYAALTGRMPLPPLFALGYQQCRWSYYPEVRVREIAREFRTRAIPADVIYLDIDYQDENRPFTIDRKGFPNFEGLIRDLGQQGFQVVAITDLHLKKQSGYQPYDAGLAGDHFVRNLDGSVYIGSVWPGESAFPDFTHAETRHWWGTLYKEFVDMGIRGFWNDMNEPAVFGRPDGTMPLEAVHRVDGRKTDHRETHNVYGMQNARATYEGVLRLQPDRRPFVLTRAAFAGTQRYAASWTGDNTSSWNHLRLSVPTLLSLGLSGYPFVGVDIGGFIGSPTPELLTRWMQLGALLPLFRNHTIKGSADQEPWVHGPEHAAIRRRAIEARYRLLPYLYTSMEETSRTGLPLMRSLFLEYPDDPALYSIDREFLLGRDLLVAAQLVELLGPYDVKLPKGDWYDYWTGERLEGGKTIKVAPSLEQIPLYVRAGAILPRQPVVQHTGETPNGPLELRVYPGPDCHGSLYQDDGKTFAFTRGEFLRVSFSCQLAAGSLAISVSAAEGSYSPWWKSMRVEVYGMDKAPKAVRVGSETITTWSFDSTQKTLTLTWPVTRGTWQILITY